MSINSILEPALPVTPCSVKTNAMQHALRAEPSQSVAGHVARFVSFGDYKQADNLWRKKRAALELITPAARLVVAFPLSPVPVLAECVMPMIKRRFG